MSIHVLFRSRNTVPQKFSQTILGELQFNRTKTWISVLLGLSGYKMWKWRVSQVWQGFRTLCHLPLLHGPCAGPHQPTFPDFLLPYFLFTSNVVLRIYFKTNYSRWEMPLEVYQINGYGNILWKKLQRPHTLMKLIIKETGGIISQFLRYCILMHYNLLKKSVIVFCCWWISNQPPPKHIFFTTSHYIFFDNEDIIGSLGQVEKRYLWK